jgi:hypothetical protein
MSKTIITSSSARYNYYVPNPMKTKFCCGVVCSSDDKDFKKAFFMDFKHGEDCIRFQMARSSCCTCDSNFVIVFRNGQNIGHLEKPFRCCDSCVTACDDCKEGSDILMMSFRNEVGKETESFTIRKKGAGCGCDCICGACASCGCSACCASCGCPSCNCKGCCTGGCDCGTCCGGTLETPTVLNEVFEVHGPMSEPMGEPKGTLTISSRRGMLFGPRWIPKTAQVSAPGITNDNDMLLLLAFAYGMLFQHEIAPASFPVFTGNLKLAEEGQGVGCD